VDYQGSISDLTKAIELKPENAGYYNSRGVSKFRAGDKRGAISDFKQAIELDPDEETYAENIASVEDDLKYQEEAKKRKAIKEKSIKDTKITNTDYNSICLKAQDYKGCMDYYSQSPKKKRGPGGAILRAIGAGLSGARVNTGSSTTGSYANQNPNSYKYPGTPYNPTAPKPFNTNTNPSKNMWTPY